ncbi:MAG: DUF4142 domain-containing protein [Planctomycetota bacterium]|nr:DUF4142 domain-containing protein [Planctomycetota bacterium]
MRLRKLTLVGTIAGLLAGCGSDDGYNSRGVTRDERPTTATDNPNLGVHAADRAEHDAGRVLSMMHASNTHEIQMGRLAEQKASSQAVREYGRALVRDHQASDVEVMRLVREFGVTLTSPETVHREMAMKNTPSVPSAEDHNAVYRRLASYNGVEFDREFARQMQMGHRRTIELLREERDRATDPVIRDLIARKLPVLEAHEQQAATLMQSR